MSRPQRYMHGIPWLAIVAIFVAGLLLLALE
jgi:hypothetical protein